MPTSTWAWHPRYWKKSLGGHRFGGLGGFGQIFGLAVHFPEDVNRVEAYVEIAAGEDDQEGDAGQAEAPAEGDVDAAGHVDAEGDFENGHGQAGKREHALGTEDALGAAASRGAVFLSADKFAG